MQNVQIRPVRDLRNNYAEVEAMLENHDPVIITKNGRGSAALINFDDYAAFEEYQHIKYIADKLQEAEEEAANPDTIWLDSKEVFKSLREKYRGL
jgi:prevent-host-death family protein